MDGREQPNPKSGVLGEEKKLSQEHLPTVEELAEKIKGRRMIFTDQEWPDYASVQANGFNFHYAYYLHAGMPTRVHRRQAIEWANADHLDYMTGQFVESYARAAALKYGTSGAAEEVSKERFYKACEEYMAEWTPERIAKTGTDRAECDRISLPNLEEVAEKIKGRRMIFTDQEWPDNTGDQFSKVYDYVYYLYASIPARVYRRPDNKWASADHLDYMTGEFVESVDRLIAIRYDTSCDAEEVSKERFYKACEEYMAEWTPERIAKMEKSKEEFKKNREYLIELAQEAERKVRKQQEERKTGK